MISLLTKKIALFLLCAGITSTAYAARSAMCMEFFASEKGLQQLLETKIYPSYKEYPETVDYLTRLMAKGVTVEFYSPKFQEDALMYSHLFVEPNVNSQWKNGQFNPKDTRIFLPKEARNIEPRQGHYQLLTQIVRIHRIFELQEQGVLFDKNSILFNSDIIITGLQENVPITNLTLGALQHAFTNFGIKRVHFIPTESLWSHFAIPPHLTVAQNVYNRSDLFLRAYYLERADYWNQLAGKLEEQLFVPRGKPFFPSQETKTH